MRVGSRVQEATLSQSKVVNHAAWNSEAGRVSGRVVKIHTRDFDYQGRAHHTSPDKPQYEIKSDRTDHVAAHYRQALSKLDD